MYLTQMDLPLLRKPHLLCLNFQIWHLIAVLPSPDLQELLLDHKMLPVQKGEREKKKKTDYNDLAQKLDLCVKQHTRPLHFHNRFIHNSSFMHFIRIIPSLFQTITPQQLSSIVFPRWGCTIIVCCHQLMVRSELRDKRRVNAMEQARVNSREL